MGCFFKKWKLKQQEPDKWHISKIEYSVFAFGSLKCVEIGNRFTDNMHIR